MEILGVGPLELFFILLIALIVLGPKDMVKAGRTIGRFMRRLVISPEWQTFQQASRELRQLPNRLMREAGVEDLQKELPNMGQIQNQIGLDSLETEVNSWQKGLTAWTTTQPGNSGDPTQVLASEVSVDTPEGELAAPGPEVEAPEGEAITTGESLAPPDERPAPEGNPAMTEGSVAPAGKRLAEPGERLTAQGAKQGAPDGKHTPDRSPAPEEKPAQPAREMEEKS